MSTHLYFTGLFLGKEDMFVFEAPEYDTHVKGSPIKSNKRLK
jgi:hypothetical protein